MSLFSDYYSKLSAVSKTRYLEKISKIGGVDPYSLPESEFSKCQEDFPDIDYPDICNYLLYSPSPVSLEEMKNYIITILFGDYIALLSLQQLLPPCFLCPCYLIQSELKY